MKKRYTKIFNQLRSSKFRRGSNQTLSNEIGLIILNLTDQAQG
ncbi:hypothetical protein BH20BAC1_BH20BAC1_22130 [soil metagenome]